MFAPQDKIPGDQIEMEVLLNIVLNFLVEKMHLNDIWIPDRGSQVAIIAMNLPVTIPVHVSTLE